MRNNCPALHSASCLPPTAFCVLACSLQPAAIHDDEQSGFVGALRRRIVDHAFLQPDRFHAQRDCFVNGLARFTRATKDVNQIDLVRNIRERRISLLAKDFCLVWIDRR